MNQEDYEAKTAHEEIEIPAITEAEVLLALLTQVERHGVLTREVVHQTLTAMGCEGMIEDAKELAELDEDADDVPLDDPDVADLLNDIDSLED